PDRRAFYMLVSRTVTCPIPISIVYSSRPLLVLRSFPTRRSSDLLSWCDLSSGGGRGGTAGACRWGPGGNRLVCQRSSPRADKPIDRKSTRLNSSHLVSSYAVFCLKKKNKQ